MKSVMLSCLGAFNEYFYYFSKFFKIFSFSHYLFPSMPPSSSSSSNHYFVSINFLLRTLLFFITLTIIILQHVFTFCKVKDRSNGTLSYDYFSPSFGFNSWSATGLYVSCWITVVQYIRTFLLVFFR